MPTTYTTGSVTSSDGTLISYRRLGDGPAVVLLHGGMQAAQNLMSLGSLLAERYRVIIPDRRGRGRSGAPQEHAEPERLVEDTQALLAAHDATRLFGLSAGALIALRTARATPSLTKVALYEPPLSIRGSVPTSWIPRFGREVQSGDLVSALITNLAGLQTEPVLGRIPRFVLTPALRTGAVSRRPPRETSRCSSWFPPSAPTSTSSSS